MATPSVPEPISSYVSQLSYLNTREHYSKVFTGRAAVAMDDFSGPKKMAEHALQEQIYCEADECSAASREGCIIRTKSIANALFLPFDCGMIGCGFVDLLLCHCPCLFCVTLCLPCAPCVWEKYTETYSSITGGMCLSMQMCAMTAAKVGSTCLRCPCNVIAPEVMTRVCHQEAFDVWQQQSTFSVLDQMLERNKKN